MTRRISSCAASDKPVGAGGRLVEPERLRDSCKLTVWNQRALASLKRRAKLVATTEMEPGGELSARATIGLTGWFVPPGERSRRATGVAARRKLVGGNAAKSCQTESTGCGSVFALSSASFQPAATAGSRLRRCMNWFSDAVLVGLLKS